MTQRKVSDHAREAGANLVEMALILPFLLLLLAGIVDFGRAYYSYMIITNAAREGARYGSSHPEEDPQWPLVRATVQMYAADSGISIPDAKVFIEPRTTAGSDSLYVQVDMDFNSIMGSFIGLSTIELSNWAIMPVLSYPG